MNHMMIDLETFATDYNAVIVSVGCVVFNKEGIIRTGYWVLDPNEQECAGRRVDPECIKWWFQQSDAVRSVIYQPKVSVAQFWTEFEQLFQEEYLHLWGNGSDFDLSLLMSFKQHFKLPNIKFWKYKYHLDYRTYNYMTNCRKLVERVGTHHNALDDAIHQAECVRAAMNAN